ncbi:MAG: hypothetical protein IPL61_33620 [Myxococcales bacterium]|nr:hypothetical protein [Myxococcales bacterium]
MSIRTLLPVLLLTAACGSAAEEGAKEAKREADVERAKAAAAVKPVDRVKAPVPQGTRLTCAQVMDPTVYTEALGELDPLTVRDSTGAMADATVSCSLIRGGVRPDAKAQDKLLKKNGRLGVLPGDEICNVTLYCWVIEEEAKFKDRCRATPTEMRSPDEGNTGGFACKETRQSGEFDIDSFRFYDTDTKCVIGVRGGPSMSDNDKIAACARAARDSIGPEHIKPDASPRYDDAPVAPPTP